MFLGAMIMGPLAAYITKMMDKLWEDEAVRFGNEAPDENCAPPTRIPANAAARQVQP